MLGPPPNRRPTLSPNPHLLFFSSPCQIANISRIMKKGLPASAKIAKDSKECVQECISEFLSFVTSEASDKCQREKRKTINGDDLLWAMSTLGFEDYVEPLKVYLAKYREVREWMERGWRERRDGERKGGSRWLEFSSLTHFPSLSSFTGRESVPAVQAGRGGVVGPGERVM